MREIGYVGGVGVRRSVVNSVDSCGPRLFCLSSLILPELGKVSSPFYRELCLWKRKRLGKGRKKGEVLSLFSQTPPPGEHR